jgi:hypothetical protein
VRQKVGGFNPLDRVLNQSAEFFALFLADDGPEVLDLDQPLADKHHLSHVGNASDPGIADQLRIQGQQPIWLLRIAAGGSLPLEQTAGAI